jgi:hypothetical protein
MPHGTMAVHGEGLCHGGLPPLPQGLPLDPTTLEMSSLSVPCGRH